MSPPIRSARRVLFALLLLSAALPFVLLAVTSVGRDWFFPALLPPAVTAGSWRELLGGGRLGGAAGTSALLALCTGVLGTLLAVPAGRLLASLRGPVRRVAAGAAFLPVAAPPIAFGIGLQYTALRVGLHGSFAGVLLAHLALSVGYLTLFFLGVFASWDARLEEEARCLGASPRQVLLRVTVPLLRRPLTESVLLGMLISWSQVPLTLLVGGGLVRTLPLEVFAFVRAGQDRFAATGALLLVVPALLALTAARLAATRTDVAAT